jgi:tRNA pseudouridine38-40 synthase
LPNQRYKLTICYRGTRYHGWQSQPVLESYKGPRPVEGEGIPTIQETLGRTISSVVGHPTNLVGSSRTDAGVHAKGQIAHFDTDKIQIPAEGLRQAVNARLPGDILVQAIDPVPDAFDAIKSTRSKRYQYFIWNASDRPVFFSDLAWHRWHELNIPAMQAAMQRLVGEHDFASFARPGHGREHTIRTIYACQLHARGPKLVFAVEGSGFLWQMVRIIVGTIVEVGLERYDAAEVQRILQSKDRNAAGPTAPAHGLFLQWVRTSENAE